MAYKGKIELDEDEVRNILYEHFKQKGFKLNSIDFKVSSGVNSNHPDLKPYAHFKKVIIEVGNI